VNASPGALRIVNQHGERLDHVLTTHHRSDAIVVLGHGVTSAHDRPYLIALCDALAGSGIDSLRFSFAGNGASDGSFAAATITKEVDDLGAVLDALGKRRVFYVGHSMGAAVGVLRAAADPRIRALVSLAGMTFVRAFCDRHFAGLVPDRDLMLGRAGCVLSSAFLADAQRIGDTLAAASRVAVPWLCVHGDADELVPLADADAAMAASSGRAKLRVLPGADHRFTDCIPAMTGAVVSWLVARRTD
jgi:uncharacterized protein